MARKSAPAAYRVTAEDLAQVCAEHAAEWGATAYWSIVLGEPTRSDDFFEVVVREGVYVVSGRELVRLRYPLSRKDSSLWPQTMLYALTMAYDRLRGDPWLWPVEKRRQAVDLDA